MKKPISPGPSPSDESSCDFDQNSLIWASRLLSPELAGTTKKSSEKLKAEKKLEEAAKKGCLYCGEPLRRRTALFRQGLLKTLAFCSADCSIDYDYENSPKVDPRVEVDRRKKPFRFKNIPNSNPKVERKLGFMNPKNPLTKKVADEMSVNPNKLILIKYNNRKLYDVRNANYVSFAHLNNELFENKMDLEVYNYLTGEMEVFHPYQSLINVCIENKNWVQVEYFTNKLKESVLKQMEGVPKVEASTELSSVSA